MRCSNLLCVVFFLVIIFFQISKNVLGYWSIGIYFLVVIVSLFIFHCIIRNCTANCDFPNFWFLFSKNVYANLINEKIQTGDSLTACLECNELNCDKHDPELKVYVQPWKELLVDYKVNAQLEQLFNLLLEQNTTWLKDISHNEEAILQEFKQVIRLVAASLLLRIKNRLKCNDIIFKKLPKYLIHHLEMYMYGKRRAKSARFLEEAVLKQYGNLLHPALSSPENEAKFHKFIANLIIHTALPYKFTKCDVSQSFLNEFICSCIISPLVKIMIDPDKVNTFLIFLLEKSPPNANETIHSDGHKVEFLAGLADCKYKMVPNFLGIERKQIFDDQHLLFLFSQYAKEECFLNVVQFVLHMNSFMNQITNPELSEQKLQDLHQHLTSMYEQYLMVNSKDYIPFESSIQTNFSLAVAEHYSNVQQFRNCKSLYEAFEFANELLDYYCRKFFHTDVYLKLICGQRSLSFNLGFEEYCHAQNSIKPESDKQALPDEGNDDFFDDIEHVKDLTNWQVSVSKINIKYDVVGREVFYFEIEICQLEGKRWVVERQFNEFYILASKLREFHGDELNQLLLPTRKPFLKVNKSMMESYRYDLELFLRHLLGNIYLKRSELLFNFLSANDFSYNYFSDNFNLGKMIKNVPSKFSKERGQHLYSFLKNFIASCEKSSIVEIEDTSAKVQKPKKTSFSESTVEMDLSDLPSVSTQRIYAHLEYLYDYLLLVLIRFYNANNWILQLLYMARPLLRQTFQSVCEYLVSKQLQGTLFTSHKMCQLIAHLTMSLKDEGNAAQVHTIADVASLTNLTKSQRSQKALTLAKEYIPKWLVEQLADFNKHEEMIFLLFSLLQHPLLNKQLLYLILNSLIADVFPEQIYQTID